MRVVAAHLSLHDRVNGLLVLARGYAMATENLDAAEGAVVASGYRAGISVPPRASMAPGALTERRGVHLLEVRARLLVHGEEAAGFLWLAAHSL